MTIFCWPCYVEEWKASKRGNPPRTILQAVVMVDGNGLCAGHANELLTERKVTP